MAYDQPETGARAESLCARIEDAQEYPFEIQPWRFNATTAAELNVRNAVTHADIFVLAWAAVDGPPEFLFQWVLDWAVQRSVTNATLAALPVGAALTNSAPVFHRLRQLAAATNLTFVCDWTEGLTAHRHDFATTMHDREQLLTPTMAGILAERHSDPRPDWGLNE